MKRTALVCFATTALVWIVFGQTLRYEFINFDDDHYVYQNPEINRGLTMAAFTWVWTHAHASLWHPLTSISHMVDCQLFGLNPAGHHFVNVLLHNLGAILLFFALREMTRRFWPSAFVATVFAIHPMRVESVAWVAERKDVLSGIFFMLALASYVRYARNPTALRYITMSILYALGLMSKATLVTVPVVLLLLDYWPLRRAQNLRDWPGLFLEKLPLFALALASSLATIAVQTVTIASLAQLPLKWRVKNALVSLVMYLRQFFWPTDLAIFYPHPHDQLPTPLVIGSALLLLGITVVAVIVRRKHPYVLVGWSWFVVVVFPVLGFLQAGLQARADRFTYLPHIGLTIALAWTIDHLSIRWRNREIVLGALAAIAVGAMTFLAARQTMHWRDSIAVWTRALAVTSNNQTAHKNLAAALWERGRTDEAKSHFRTAQLIHAQTILKDYPLDAGAHDELGVLLIHEHKPREAIAHWETALRADSDDGNALSNLAWTLATYPDDAIRDGARAIAYAEAAVRLPGGDVPIVQRTLAAACAENGEFARAIDVAERAMQVAQAQSNSSLVETLRHEIALYRDRTAYREWPPPD